jgi:alpha-glucosidase
MRHTAISLLLLTACARNSETIGAWQVDLNREIGTIDITHTERGDSLRGLRFGSGTGSYELEQAFGSYRFDEVERELSWSRGFQGTGWFDAVDELVLDDEHGAPIGALTMEFLSDDAIVLRFEPHAIGPDRVALQADCDTDDHFLGLGGHAMDVDHVGQAFPLFVHEPGVGKATDEDYPADWSLTGTRHASSYPVPFLLRPHQAHGLLLNTDARVEVDLCASDSRNFEATAWEGPLELVLISGDGPLDVVQHASEHWGRIQQPPPWGLGAWVDAVGGSERVREVAAVLREAGAAVSAIWTEDWKGFELQTTGYRLSNEWFLDRELYPDAEDIDAELEAAGLKWLAYFSAFVAEDTVTWDEAMDAGVLIQDEAGEPYTFLGVSLKQTSLVDYTHPDADLWSAAWMRDCLEIGFDGWMADYGEWLPTDAVLHDGSDAMLEHNRYPERWQATNLGAIEGYDATFFSRSGWAGAQGLSPVVWGGDQRTSFDSDDGFPTVLALGLGLAASGVPVYTHDIAGYNSVGNDPSDKELWFRWAGLGAYSPIMRTHHGAFDEENHQFDRDEETLAYLAALTQEHARLYPYRSGLAREAAELGSPMVRPVSFHYGEDWGRMDAWLLGSALLVAPVLERGVEGREVDLPSDVAWTDWHSLEPASGGWFDAAMDHTPVFAAAGTTVPTFTTVPDTLAQSSDPELLDLADVDGERTVYLFGGGGPFVEGDGTRYAPSGAPTSGDRVTQTLTAGVIEVAGVSLSIEGEVERSYTVVVVD